jgi:peptidoglycan/LPS O-acetylase OafA/YrhL
MQYRPDIDGLRAIAVLSVILYHAGIPGFAGGYVGVDVFFVISGYLITQILLRDLAAGRFSLARFYERRARRILPALFCVLLCCLPPALLWMRPAELAGFGAAIAAVILFVSNILFWRQIDYFDETADLNPLLHTWSLAIEEQYYIFFPLALALLWRLGRRAPALGMGLVFLASLALAEALSQRMPGANFYLLPSRAWELMAGSLAAWAHLRRPAAGPTGPGAAALAWLGLACVLLPVPLYDDQTPFPSLYALLPVGGAVLLMLFGAAPLGARRVLALRPMVGIGLISYSAYLWHQPVLAFARRYAFEPPGLPALLGLCLLSLVLAFLSWKFVEQPFRHGPRPLLPGRRGVFAASLAGGVAFLSVAALFHVSQGLPQRIAPSGQSFASLDIDPRLRPIRGASTACSDAPRPDLAACPAPPGAVILLWGDSFAMHLGPALRASRSGGEAAVAEFTKPVCAPLLGAAVVNAAYPEPWSRECLAFNDAVLDWLQAHPQVTTVVLSSPLGVLDYPLYLRDGRILRDRAEVGAEVRAALLATAERVRALGRRVIFVSPPPQSGEDLSACAVHSLVFGTRDPENCSFPAGGRSARNAAALDLLAGLGAGLPVLWLDDILCQAGRCQTLLEGRILYRDSGHFSREGSRLLGEIYDLAGRAMALAR